MRSILKMNRDSVLCAGCRRNRKSVHCLKMTKSPSPQSPTINYRCTYVNVFCYCPIICFHFLVSETRRVVKFERNEQRFIRLKHLVERLDKFEI